MNARHRAPLTQRPLTDAEIRTLHRYTRIHPMDCSCKGCAPHVLAIDAILKALVLAALPVLALLVLIYLALPA